MAEDLINGWQYSRDSTGAVRAVDPKGRTQIFSNWDAFWRAAHGQARPHDTGQTIGRVIVGGALAVIALVYVAQQIPHQSPPPPEVALGRGEEMVVNLGCGGKWSDDKKKAIFESDYKDKLTTITGTITKAGSGVIDLKVLPSTLTSDVDLKMANTSDTYNLNKDQIVTVRFVPTRLGGCFLPFYGDQGVIVSK